MKTFKGLKWEEMGYIWTDIKSAKDCLAKLRSRGVKYCWIERLDDEAWGIFLNMEDDNDYMLSEESIVSDWKGETILK